MKEKKKNVKKKLNNEKVRTIESTSNFGKVISHR